MICPNCGASNPPLRGTCTKCGRALNPLGTGSPRPAQPARPVIISTPTSESYTRKAEFTHEEIVNKMKLDYSYAHGDMNHRALEGVTGLVAHAMVSPLDRHALLQEACNLIQKQFSIREVAVGLKDEDGIFRFKELVGFRVEADRAMRQCAYKQEDFSDAKTYKGKMISRYTKVYLAEDSPYREDEKDTYSRPLLLDTKRRSPTESLEGDYLDCYIFGPEDELLGWIETSGTRAGELPDIMTIKWIELIAQIIGQTLSSKAVRRAAG